MGAPRVLYVEDEPELRVMIADVLDEYGFRVEAVGSAEEALARLIQQGVDVLLTDYNLPGRNADWLVAQARSHGLLPDARMVVLSSERSAVGVERLRFLPKPVDLDDLVGALYAAAGLPPFRPELAQQPGALAVSQRPIRLILYVCPNSIASGHALSRIKRILSRYPDGTVSLDVVDVTAAPHAALAADAVAFTPLLVSRDPGRPPVRVIGDLSKERVVCDVLYAAGLDPAS